MTEKRTVQIDARLHATAKKLSARSGVSVTRFVEDGLRAQIAKLKEQRA